MQLVRTGLRDSILQLTSQMIQDIEKDEEQFEFSEREDVHSISNVLKQCLSPSYLEGTTAADVPRSERAT